EGAALPPPVGGEAGDHRLGSGQKLVRRQRVEHLGEASVRPLLHQELVDLPRHADLAAHRAYRALHERIWKVEESTRGSFDYIRLLRRVVLHRWRIILAGLLIVVVPTIAFVVLSTENLYEASATLFILPESSDSIFLRDFTSPET